MPKTQYLSTPIKSAIVSAVNSGKKKILVARDFNVSRGTVTKICQRVEETQTVQRKPIPGRPRKTTKRQENAIVRHNKQDPNRSATDAVDYAGTVCGVKISKWTARRILNRARWFARKPACKPLTKKVHQRARLKFARAYKHWNEWEWARVLWSDETKINLYYPDGNHVIRRPVGKRYDVRYTRLTVKFGLGKINVWG